MSDTPGTAGAAGEKLPPPSCLFEGEMVSEKWPGMVYACVLPAAHDGPHRTKGAPLVEPRRSPCMVLVGDGLCPEVMVNGRCKVHGGSLAYMPASGKGASE